MGNKISREVQTLVVGLATLGAATLIIIFAVAGFVTGLIIPGFFLALWAGAAALDRRMVPDVLKNPSRDEWFVIVATTLLIIGTAIVAAIVDTYAWVVIPLAGFMAIHSAYGLSHRGDRRSARLDEDSRGGVHSPPDVIMSRWFGMLEEVDIFRTLTHEQLKLVVSLGVVKTIRDGGTMGVEGQKGTSTYVLLEGQAELSAYSPIGRITARVAGPGESLPLASILGDGLLITSVHARSDITVWEVNSDRLKAFFIDHPEVAVKVYKSAATILADRYRSTLRRLTDQSAAVLHADEFWVNV